LATANTESSLSTFGLSHFPQSTLAEAELTIFSKRAPQSWHLYSKIGIDVPLLQYIEWWPTIQWWRKRIFQGSGRCAIEIRA
jgi:hypothetical protein